MLPQFLIVDDHMLFCNGMENIIRDHFDAEVTCINNPLRALELDLKEITLIITDLDMPQMKGFDFIIEAGKRNPNLKFLVISMHKKGSILKRAVELGVKGYIVKDEPAEVFVEGIKNILNGEEYFSKDIMLSSVRLSEQTLKLTKREREVLMLLAEGKLMKEVADELGLSFETVKTHSKNIRTKLGSENKTEMIKYAKENLLI